MNLMPKEIVNHSSISLTDILELNQDKYKDVDVCIVCATMLEAKTLIVESAPQFGLIFRKAHNRQNDTEYYISQMRNFQGEIITILVAWQSVYGSTATVSLLQDLLHKFHPRFIAMTGTCGGDKRHTKLGDIIIADRAFAYDDVEVAMKLEKQKKSFTNFYAIDPLIHRLVLDFHQQKYIRPYIQLPTKPQQQLSLCTPQTLPNCHITSMASVKNVRRDNPFDKMQALTGRIKALDMESAAFYKTAAQFSDVYALLVKGVADYADTDKNDLFYQYASAVSAMYVLCFIQAYVTQALMPRRSFKGEQL